MLSSRELARTNATFMSRVYFWMMLALVISGGVAYSVSHHPAIINYIMTNRYLPISLIVLQLAAVILISACLNRMSLALTSLIYIVYAALTGLTLSIFCLAFTSQSITEAFFITAFAFIGLSVFGLITKRDLGPIGSFCMTGLFGLIGFIFVVWLFPSIATNAVSMTINTLAILIFSGLTAYDTQRIKNMNIGLSNGSMLSKMAISGALMLYLDFLNLFINILSLFGDRK